MSKLKKIILIIIIIIAVIIVIGILLPKAGCKKEGPAMPAINNNNNNAPAESNNQENQVTPFDTPKLPARGFYMGLTVLPAENQTFDEAYAQAAQYSEFVPIWGKPTPFYDLAKTLAGKWGELFVQKCVRSNNMFPLFNLSFLGKDMTLESPSDIPNATLSDPKWRAAYKQAAIDIVKTSRPLYLSLGNEVNRWYEKYGAKDGDPNGFQNYVSLYNEIYDAVKQISPQTKVYCIFAREIVKENREANLEVLKMFDPARMDLLVFTSYPTAVHRGMDISKPSDIPDDYYSRALKYMPGKPFGFSELGWQALPPFGGEQAQADFIMQAANRLTRDQGVKLELFGWAWLHGLDKNDPVGLIKKDGTETLGYQAWKKLSGR